MIETGYTPLLEPEVAENNDASLPIQPLVDGAIKLVKETGKVMYNEAIAPGLAAPALTKQQEQAATNRLSRNQKDLLDIALAQLELDIQEAQSPSRVLTHMFSDSIPDAQTMNDAKDLVGVCAELAQAANPQPETLYNFWKTGNLTSDMVANLDYLPPAPAAIENNS